MDELLDLDARVISVIGALIQQRLASNRWHAQQLIEERRVFFGKHCISNIGEMVSVTIPLRVVATPMPSKSPPSSNLLYGMDKFRFSARGRIAVDLGTLEGDCTRVLLENGIRRTFAISVGEGKVKESVANDPRVTILQSVNLQQMHRGFLPLPLSAIVIDSRADSVKKLIKYIHRFAAPSCWLLAFIYPEIECPKEAVPSKDKQVDQSIMRRISMEVKEYIEDIGYWRVLGAVLSPYIPHTQPVRSIVIGAEHLTITK